MSGSRITFGTVMLILIFSIPVMALRTPRPNTFNLPWDDDQMSQHNDAHEDMWNISNGRHNLDIVTTSKLRANNGDIWMIITGNTVRLQIKANDRVYTLQDQEVD